MAARPFSIDRLGYGTRVGVAVDVGAGVADGTREVGVGVAMLTGTISTLPTNSTSVTRILLAVAMASAVLLNCAAIDWSVSPVSTTYPMRAPGARLVGNAVWRAAGNRRRE